MKAVRESAGPGRSRGRELKSLVVRAGTDEMAARRIAIVSERDAFALKADRQPAALGKRHKTGRAVNFIPVLQIPFDLSARRAGRPVASMLAAANIEHVI